MILFLQGGSLPFLQTTEIVLNAFHRCLFKIGKRERNTMPPDKWLCIGIGDPVRTKQSAQGIFIPKNKSQVIIMLLNYRKTIDISLHSQTNGGIFYLLPNVFIRLLYLVPLMALWTVLVQSGADVGMSLRQMLTYTYINALLTEMMNVQTAASSWCYEGELLKLYTRPMPIFGQLIAQTIGGWIPMLLLFSLPMLCIAPLFGVTVIPSTLWFFPSLFLCVSLGFAIDFLFTCVTIQLRGISWLAHVIRMAIYSLFSGTVVPFKLLPFGLTNLFEYQPFGSLGGAPLSLFAGTSPPVKIILIQLFWNLLLWPVAALWLRKSQERMVSFGG